MKRLPCSSFHNIDAVSGNCFILLVIASTNILLKFKIKNIMKTSWRINLTSEINSDLLLKKALIISSQISRACLMNGRNIIKIPTKLMNVIDEIKFNEHFDVLYENELDKIIIYRSDIFDVKHFIQKINDEIVGVGIKFSGELFDNEELINIERMCGEINLPII